MIEKKASKKTSQTVRIPAELAKPIGHRLVDIEESFQGYVMRLIRADIEGAGKSAPPGETVNAEDRYADEIEAGLIARARNGLLYWQETHRLVEGQRLPEGGEEGHAAQSGEKAASSGQKHKGRKTGS